MPIQARAIAAAFGLAVMSGVAQAECADENLGSKLAAAGFQLETQDPINGPKEMVFPPLSYASAPLEAEVRVLLIIAPDGAIADRVVLCAEPFGYFEATVLQYAKAFAFAPLQTTAPAKYRTYTWTVKFKTRYEVPRFASPSRLDP